MRQTPLVKTVLHLLEQSKKPLSVPEIQAELVKEQLTPNKTTLYRMFEKLESEGVLEALLLDPKVIYYEFKTHHHHHFRCNSCDAIKCISDPELETQIHALEHKLKTKGLTIKDHHFSLSGKCAAC
jgi:Fe2+ or Zn2+ uptake regulation protein